MKKLKIKTIYLGLRKGGSIMYPLILLFMRMYIIKKWMLKKVKSPFKKIYNHAFIVIEYEDDSKFVLETNPNVTFTTFDGSHYGKGGKYENNIILKEFIYDYNKINTTNNYHKLHDFILNKVINKKYEYMNFIYQAVYIITGIWLGKTYDNKKWYCTELTAAFINDIDEELFKHWYKENPLTLDLNENFK